MSTLSYYTEEEINALREKWQKEEFRLNNTDVCGFKDELLNEDVLNYVSDRYLCGLSGTKQYMARAKYEALVADGKSDTRQARFLYMLSSDDYRKARKEYESWLDTKGFIDRPELSGQSVLESPSYAVYADCLRITVPHQSVPLKCPGGVRGKCKGFTPASRLRMKKKLAKLNLKGTYSFFISLTYPSLYTSDMSLVKRDLDTFRKSLTRAFPSFIGGFWRLELQKRGAPHFHMLLVSEKQLSRKKIIKFIGRRWPDIVRSNYFKSGGDESAYRPHYKKHQKSCMNVQFMQNRDMVTNYISKYISKVDEIAIPDDIGRCWGQWQFNGKKLDFTVCEADNISRKDVTHLKRMISKHKVASNRLTPTEDAIVKGGKLSGIQDKALAKKLRRHRHDKKYAKRIAKQNTITVFGYGIESNNNGVIKKMLEETRRVTQSVSSDLINAHISPAYNSQIDTVVSNGVRFMDRVESGDVIAPNYAKRKVECLVSRLANYHVRWVPDCENWCPCECGCELRRPDVDGAPLCCNCMPAPLWPNKLREDIQESRMWCEYARK